MDLANKPNYENTKLNVVISLLQILSFSAEKGTPMEIPSIHLIILRSHGKTIRWVSVIWNPIIGLG